MFRFIRKLRQRLLTENKFSKYLLYAVGEILLVVIGILIALQLDTWNENRIENSKKDYYLKAINSDFKANKLGFEAVLKGNKENIDISDQLISMFPITDENVDSVLAVYATRGTSIERLFTFDPNHSSLEALLNSPVLDQVKNKDLERYLITWRQVYEDFKENESRFGLFVTNGLKPFRLENIRTPDYKDRSVALDKDKWWVFENYIRERRNNLSFIFSDPVGEIEEMTIAIDSIIWYTDPGNTE